MIKEIIPSKLNGCLEIILNKTSDNRGNFIKTFHEKIFSQHQIKMTVAEEYYSTSVKNVFRGMHFQLPPMDHEKIVICMKGEVRDYVLDLRKASETYGQYTSFDLHENEPKLIYIPKGMAHGFHVLSDEALLLYKVSSVYDAATDTGINYRSLPFAKDIKDPLISERDLSFPSLENFKSPF